MKLALTQLITATITAVLFLLLNRAGEKKISAYGRYLAGIILAASFLVPMRIPLIRIEIPETKIENTGFTQEHTEQDAIFFPPKLSAKNNSSVTPPAQTGTPSSADSVPSAAANAEEHTFFLTPEQIAGVLWLCGALVFLLCTFYRYCRTAKALRRCGRAPTEREWELFLSVCEKVGVKDAPELLVCPSYCFRSSLTFGLRRGTILISDKFSQEDFCVILGHELTHCRRKDSLVKAFLVLLRAAYWFNLVTYLFIRTMNQLCEQSCDEKFLAGKGSEEKAHYLRLLVLSSAEKEHSNKLLFNAFKGGNTQMKKRITNILQNKNKKGAAIVISLALVAAILSAVVYAVALPMAAEPAQNEGGDAATTETRYFFPRKTSNLK